MNDGDGKKMLQLRKCPGFLRLHFYPIRKLWRGYAKSGPSSVLKTFVVYRLLCTFFFFRRCRLLRLSAPFVSSTMSFCSTRVVCYVFLLRSYRLLCPHFLPARVVCSFRREPRATNGVVAVDGTLSDGAGDGVRTVVIL